jgi:hypothetical protein
MIPIGRGFALGQLYRMAGGHGDGAKWRLPRAGPFPEFDQSNDVGRYTHLYLLAPNAAKRRALQTSLYDLSIFHVLTVPLF